VDNFRRDWSDGRAFVGLVNALQPGSMDLNEYWDPKKNCNDSFENALKFFNIPKVLDSLPCFLLTRRSWMLRM
jgi:hypothetical protein